MRAHAVWNQSQNREKCLLFKSYSSIASEPRYSEDPKFYNLYYSVTGLRAVFTITVAFIRTFLTLFVWATVINDY